MKQRKVKLIHEIRSEKELFRLWKQERKKELIQLRVQDRRCQNEMAHMECLHTKQQNVRKRKVEEAAAVNKRLKVGADMCARACLCVCVCTLFSHCLNIFTSILVTAEVAATGLNYFQ
jgi:hypothetical protein